MATFLKKKSEHLMISMEKCVKLVLLIDSYLMILKNSLGHKCLGLDFKIKIWRLQLMIDYFSIDVNHLLVKKPKVLRSLCSYKKWWLKKFKIRLPIVRNFQNSFNQFRNHASNLMELRISRKSCINILAKGYSM